MSPTLRDELRQTKPFTSLEHEAHLSVLRTAALLEGDFEQLLKPHGITGAQYNVLRILRGAEPDGLCRNEVRDRLVTRMPDVTRLLDRMEEAGLVTRERSDEDRRMVRTRLTRVGRRLVDGLDAAAAEQHARAFRHLDRQQLRALIDLLQRAREA
jgi:DNA-binding MarR family transcriptional regulator